MNTDSMAKSTGDEDFKQAVLDEISEQKRFRKGMEMAARALIGKNCSECKLPIGFDLHIPDFDLLDIIDFKKFLMEKRKDNPTM